MERLASGKRINSANDDAAGMAVAAKMRADIRSLNQAVRNTNDAISLVNTYDGAAAEIESILIRMRELAVQAKTGTYSAADLTLANYEYEALKTEISRIAKVSAFNRQILAQGKLDASGNMLSSDGTTTFSFYVGADVARSGNAITFSAASLDLNWYGNLQTVTSGGGTEASAPVHNENLSAYAAGKGFTFSASQLGITTEGVSAGLRSIANATYAGSAIVQLDDALSALGANRATAGAMVNRLEHTVSNLMNVSQRLQEAASGIEDADYAAESAALARGMVLAQAGTAMLAQANQAPQFVLTLLRS
jgi:flagellin